jgi:hypothetical protein
MKVWKVQKKQRAREDKHACRWKQPTARDHCAKELACVLVYALQPAYKRAPPGPLFK